jgi:cytochrome c oxidase subunit 2
MVNPTPWSSARGLKWFAGALAVAGAALAAPAFAAQPVDWQIWHQPAATPNMAAIESFDWLTLYVIVPITLFVLILLALVIFRFNAKSHPVPEKTTHNTAIEVVWTLGPVAVLVFLAIPSFQLLSSQFNPPEPPSLTIKATGYQWYWGYEYQDVDAPFVVDAEAAEQPGDEAETLSFESRPVGVAELAGTEAAALKEREDLGKTDLAEYPRLLAVDNELVVPVGRVVRVLVTAGDVIHNFAMPAFGLKMDGYPGRLNETFFQATREGLYYGQCSELCGKFHAYMPIGIRVVSQEQYDAWREAAGNDLQAANASLKAEIVAAKAVQTKIDVATDGSIPAAAATN